mmetsp:Transcript_28950/g.112642  ORF Transcript_28950/g.112642 Transcript_28950/m.112642 type:complete len:200 (+) Transcript_28950:4066-4665(+)
MCGTPVESFGGVRNTIPNVLFSSALRIESSSVPVFLCFHSLACDAYSATNSSRTSSKSSTTSPILRGIFSKKITATSNEEPRRFRTRLRPQPTQEQPESPSIHGAGTYHLRGSRYHLNLRRTCCSDRWSSKPSHSTRSSMPCAHAGSKEPAHPHRRTRPPQPKTSSRYESNHPCSKQPPKHHTIQPRMRFHPPFPLSTG